ncbi:MAG: trypsin-like serine protease [Ruminococcus sp.]|nr:trypsin-like serine protease [Ruminococcus sp.]
MSIKKLTALALTTAVMLVVIVSTAIVPALADSGADTRRYRKYNYATGNYTTYNLTVDYDADYSVNARSIIGGTNEMVESSETAVVHLDGSGGTGFIIGKNLIATAAHCVYSNGAIVSNVVRIIDANGAEVATYEPIYYHIPMEYGQTGNSNYDYALIELDSNVNLMEYGRIYLGLATDEFMASGKNVTVTGFPQLSGDDVINGWVYGKRYQAIAPIVYLPNDENADQRLFYTADTSGGDSGGPVYITETMQSGDVYKTAIGIHTHGGNTYNSGVRITSPVLKFYMGNPYVNL